ncbi:hypothetical protein CR513_50406, partial [Mucuna pruriens]
MRLPNKHEAKSTTTPLSTSCNLLPKTHWFTRILVPHLARYCIFCQQTLSVHLCTNRITLSHCLCIWAGDSFDVKSTTTYIVYFGLNLVNGHARSNP